MLRGRGRSGPANKTLTAQWFLDRATHYESREKKHCWITVWFAVIVISPSIVWHIINVLCRSPACHTLHMGECSGWCCSSNADGVERNRTNCVTSICIRWCFCLQRLFMTMTNSKCYAGLNLIPGLGIKCIYLYIYPAFDKSLLKMKGRHCFP